LEVFCEYGQNGRTIVKMLKQGLVFVYL